MTVVCEIAFTTPKRTASPAAELRQKLATLPGLAWLDHYVPALGATHDPYVQDSPAPAHLAMLAFASLPELAEATSGSALTDGLSGLSAISCSAMRCLHSPVAGTVGAPSLLARFSYVVRYHRPADDEAAFVRHYLKGHPPLIGRLPDIRNVITYIPLPWQLPGGPPPADYLLGNEATFDDAGAFNAAMASPVRHELRAHYRTLPRLTGRNTHFAMERTRLLG